MKKNLILTLALILLTNVSVAKAVSDENVTERRREKSAEIQEIRSENKAKRESVRSEVAKNHADRLEKRFAAYYARLSSIIVRFRARLSILKAEGKSVSSIETELASASSKLESAKQKGIETVAAFRSIDPSLIAARDLANETRKLFEEVNTSLKSALKLLKYDK